MSDKWGYLERPYTALVGNCF